MSFVLPLLRCLAADRLLRVLLAAFPLLWLAMTLGLRLAGLYEAPAAHREGRAPVRAGGW
jgi:hypothetical protein